MKNYDLKNSEMDRKAFYGRLIVEIILFIGLVVATVFSLLHLPVLQTDEDFSVGQFVFKIGFAYVLFLFSSWFWIVADTQGFGSYPYEITDEFRKFFIPLLIMLASIILVLSTFLRIF